MSSLLFTSSLSNNHHSPHHLNHLDLVWNEQLDPGLDDMVDCPDDRSPQLQDREQHRRRSSSLSPLKMLHFELIIYYCSFLCEHQHDPPQRKQEYHLGMAPQLSDGEQHGGNWGTE